VTAPTVKGRLPRRVLFVIAYPQRMAGANRSLFHLVTHLPPEVEPVVALTGEGQVADAFRAAGVRCVILPAQGAIGSYGKALIHASVARKAWIAAREVVPFARRMARVIRELEVDLVHTNEPRAALLAAAATRLARRPLVAHLRGEFVGGRLFRTLYELAARRIVCVSQGARATLGLRGRRKATVVYNGIGALPAGVRPVPWLQALRDEGRVVVTCFATVVPFKGFHHLLRAVALLNERGAGARAAFVCVGEEMPGYEWYHAALRELQDELGVGNVTWAGWQEDPFPFYAASDLTVLPSVSEETLEMAGRSYPVRGNEGFPRTHLEAMQFALPVVGTRIAGVPEQVEDGATGILVPPGDPAALADALETLLNDAGLRRRMGARGRERVRELFSTEAYVAGVLDVYRETLG
jgi:glycosyltransferase involved in cell wall biosynthesis